MIDCVEQTRPSPGHPDPGGEPAPAENRTLSLLSWVVTGLIVGLVARAPVPGRQHIGALPTIALGIVGACVGGLVSAALCPTWTNDPDVDRMWPGWLLSVIGAVAVPWGYLAITGRKDASYANRSGRQVGGRRGGCPLTRPARRPAAPRVPGGAATRTSTTAGLGRRRGGGGGPRR